MALLYPILMTNEGIKINMLIFRFTSSLIPKEICSLNKVTILKDIKKERIRRTKGHLTEKSLDDQFTDNVRKKFKQDIETEIYSPTAFLHRHWHIVQTPCVKEFSGKNIKDGTMLTISFSQCEWTNNLTDVLIKEVLTNSPLLIIKENINCGNFLNKDIFNFLTNRVNHKSLTNLSINGWHNNGKNMSINILRNNVIDITPW